MRAIPHVIVSRSHSGRSQVTTVVHLCDAVGSSPFFDAIAGGIGPSYRTLVGSIRPASSFQDGLRQAGHATYALGCRSRVAYAAGVIRLVRLLRREKAALLHAHGFDPTFLGLLAARLARCPFVFTRHHSDHHVRLHKPLHVALDGWCARRADRVIAVSEATREVMLTVEAVPPERVVVVYNGVALAEDPPPMEVERLKSELQIGPGGAVLMPARLHEEKGHRHFLRAWARVRAQFPGTKAFLAGEGPERQAIQDLISSLELGDSVQLLGYREDVRVLMAASTLVCLTSLAESFGQVITEAMALGRPVVAFATGGVPELVENGRTGLLVSQGDADGIAVALSDLLADPGRRLAMGERARERAREFSYARMLRGYGDVYDNLLRE